MSISSVEILEELKENDHEMSAYNKGLSVLSEDQWNFVINNFKNKQKEYNKNKSKQSRSIRKRRKNKHSGSK